MKMKKYLAILVVLTMAFGLAGALADDDPFAALGTFEMVCGHAQNEGHPRYTSMEQFAADVAEKTNGHVVVTVHGSGTLGTEKEMLEQVVTGIIQGLRGGHYDFSPRLLMFTAPFLCRNSAEVTALLQSDLATEVCMSAEEATSTVIINLCSAGGFRQFSNNVRPIIKPEDLAGLKMRAPNMSPIVFTLEGLGASVVSIAFADLYMSLKTGVADGQENPWAQVVGSKLYEVQKYFTIVNYQFHPDPFYINAEWWNALPEELQTIVYECATDMGEYNDLLIDQTDAANMQQVIDYGCEVYVPTAEELAAFQEACMPVYQKMIEAGICTQEEIDEMIAIVAQVRGE
ncbi:MAG: TRAP transporter substrate-binding protein [Bacillota bacterium]